MCARLVGGPFPVAMCAPKKDVRRLYLGMSVSPDYLLAATVVATVVRDYGQLHGPVELSQMTATSTAESHQQRLRKPAQSRRALAPALPILLSKRNLLGTRFA
jgi:hypothetical protein